MRTLFLCVYVVRDFGYKTVSVSLPRGGAVFVGLEQCQTLSR